MCSMPLRGHFFEILLSHTCHIHRFLPAPSKLELTGSMFSLLKREFLHYSWELFLLLPCMCSCQVVLPAAGITQLAGCFVSDRRSNDTTLEIRTSLSNCGRCWERLKTTGGFAGAAWKINYPSEIMINEATLKKSTKTVRECS